MDIEGWRNEIDEIDMELLRLLNIRARLAIKIGDLKRAARLPLCNPQREAEVLAHVREANAGPLDDDMVAGLFRQIIVASRQVEGSSCEQAPRTLREVTL